MALIPQPALLFIPAPLTSAPIPRLSQRHGIMPIISAPLLAAPIPLVPCRQRQAQSLRPLLFLKLTAPAALTAPWLAVILIQPKDALIQLTILMVSPNSTGQPQIVMAHSFKWKSGLLMTAMVRPAVGAVARFILPRFLAVLFPATGLMRVFYLPALIGLAFMPLIMTLIVLLALARTAAA